MRLLQYKLNVGPSVSAMDSYFHLMFQKEIRNINGKGEIVKEHIEGVNLNKLRHILSKLTKEHPVGWQLKVYHRGKEYEFTAEAGEVEYRRVRAITNVANEQPT